MSGKLEQEAATFENKIRTISEHLKDKVLTPAEQEKERILSQATAEKERIIAQAEKKAEEIVRAAEEKARLTLSTAESSLRLAVRQAVDTLKIALEKEVLTRTLQGMIQETEQCTDLMKDLLFAVVQSAVGTGAGQVEIVLSNDLKKRLGDFLKGKIVAQAMHGIALSDDTIPSGFSVRFVDKGFSYEFTHEALIELLSEFVRPEMRSYLFEK